jgi:release factor glutamine methyltransferase
LHLQGSSIDVRSYGPADDTFFFAGYVEKEKGSLALEIGTGSGYLTKILEQNFETVVGTDISFNSLRSQKERILNPICCDGAGALRGRFDLVICNLPYLPSDVVVDRAVDGGPEGLLIPIHIMESVVQCTGSGSKVLLLTSSLASWGKLIKKIESMGFKVKVIGKKKMFFEELVVLEATRN